MPGGRPRNPDDLKILEGTWRKDRDGSTVPVANAEGIPNPPPHLKGEALDFWKAIVPGLIAGGIAKEMDAPELAGMCEWWARHRRFTRTLDKMKATDKNLYQTTVLCGIAWTNFDKIAARFAMSPSDRAKLRVPASGVGKKKGPVARNRSS